MMKKILVMAAVAMMTAMSVQAQDGYDDTKHEIGISYGGLSNSTWQSIGDNLGSSILSLGTVRYDDGNITGAIGLEYFYHVSAVVGLGAIGTYTKETKDMFIVGDKYGEAKNTFISVLPAAKFNWLRKKYFGMYSKLAVGASFTSKKEDYTKGSTEDRSESEVNFNWQASILGLEAGSPYLRGFLELGVGEQGVFVAGIRCKF
jgi:hypothetical protein